MKRLIILCLIFTFICGLAVAEENPPNQYYCYIIFDGIVFVEGVLTQMAYDENHNTVQLKINDKYYLTSYDNILLISESGTPFYGAWFPYL